MIYEVTYLDADGNELLQGTFNANNLTEAVTLVVSTPAMQPPPNATDVKIRVIK